MEKSIIAYIEQLYKELDTIKINENITQEEQLQKQQAFLQELIDDLSKNVDNIYYLKIDSVLPLIYQKYELANIKEQFRLIKLVLDAKLNKHFTVKLTNEQTLLIQEFLNLIREHNQELHTQLEDLKTKKNKDLARKSSIEDQIIDLEILIEKIQDPQNIEELTAEEFLRVYSTVLKNPNLSYQEQKQFLLDWQSYNEDRRTNKKKESKRASLEELIELYQKYQVEKVIPYLKKHQEEILCRANSHEVEEILKYLQEEDIVHHKPNLLSRFEAINLLVITTFGTLNSVKERYEELAKEGKMANVFFNTPSIWIRNLPVSRKRKMEQTKKSKKNENKSTLLTTIAHKVSFEELVENEKYLQSLGFDVSLDLGHNVATLKTNSLRLKENIGILKKYDILHLDQVKHFAISTLTFSDLATKCDQAIELGLLNPLEESAFPGANNIKKYPSNLIKISEEKICALLYKLKNELPVDEYYHTILSEKNNRYLKRDFMVNGYQDMVGNKPITEFKQENFASLEDEIPLFKEFEEYIANNFGVNFNPQILQDPLIINLETNHHIVDKNFHYVFGTIVISRLKVLRIYSILKEQFPTHLEDALLYAITYQSYLSKNSLEKLKTAIQNKKGVIYGLS